MLTANETNKAKNTQTPATLDISNNPYLSVVYKKSFLKNLLSSTKEGYTLVGLLFKKLYDKEFTIYKLYYRPTDEKPFAEEQTTQNGPDFVEHYLTSTNKANNFIEHAKMVDVDNQLWRLKNPQDQKSIKESSILQFWDVIDKEENEKLDPLVFLSKNNLELLLRSNVDRICISGANVDYGIGFYNFESEQVNEVNKTCYPTLKAEINTDAGPGAKNVPNVALGLTCPPAWAMAKKVDVTQEVIEVKNRKNLDTSFYNEVINNYILYNLQSVRDINTDVHNPRSGGTIPTNALGLNDININNLSKHWNEFLTGN